MGRGRDGICEYRECDNDARSLQDGEGEILTREDVRRLTGALVALWLLGLGGATYARASVWKSELSLWSAAVVVTPNKPRPWINLGLAREAAGDFPGAFAAQQAAFALAFQPRLTRYQQRFAYVASQTNLARLFALTGREEAAERLLTHVLSQFPLFPHAHWNAGVLLARLGRCQEAQPHWAVALALEPGFGPMPQCAP